MVQAAEPRWELCVFLSTHRSPFIFQLPKRHVDPDRKTISKSLYPPETSGTQACLYSEPLSAQMEMCALWGAQLLLTLHSVQSDDHCPAQISWELLHLTPWAQPGFLPVILDEWQGVLNGKDIVISPWGPLWLVSTSVVLPTSPSSALNWHKVCHISTASCQIII